MKYLLLIGLFFAFVIPKSNAYLPNVHKQELNKSQQITKPRKGKNKPKFRWKRVFRPIMIFNQKWSFWLLWFGGLFVISWAIFGLTIKSGKYDSVFDADKPGAAYSLLALSALVIFLLLAFPIIFIKRLIKEIRIRNRYRKCPKPSRSKLR